jgi:two-component system NtrC family sensor kinase
MPDDEIILTTSQFLQVEKLSLLGAMLAGITHEINNPLNYVSMAKDNLKDEIVDLDKTLKILTEDPEAEEIRKKFQQKFDKLYALLSDIEMGLSKVSAINSSMRNYSRVDQVIDENVALREILEETEIILANKLKRFNYTKYIDSIPNIACNRSQISQVVANLLTNACDSLSEKKGKINSFDGQIRAKIFHLREDVVRIQVEDNGDGIKLDILDRIFEPFFTTKSKSDGMGLGLTISMNIIKNHKGIISVSQSEDLGGAKFIIDLPIFLKQEK